MLLDTLGIIIGFITIVLLLSILVTAIVQTIVSTSRLRHRKLRDGLAASNLLDALQTATGFSGPKKESPAAAGTPQDKGAAKTAAKTESPEDSATAKQKLFQRIWETIEDAQSTQDPRATWLEDKQVIDPLKTAGVAETGIALVQYALDTARRRAEDKLLQWSRGLTFGLSVLVAFLFAASVPDLLNRLSEDAEFRARAEALGEKIAHQTPTEYSTIVLGSPGLRARTAFLRKYPAYAVQLGGLRFEAASVDDLVANFETAMDAEPQRDALAAEFRTLVDKELEEESDRAADAARRAVTDLAAIGLEPIRNFNFYYTKDATGNYDVNFDRILGVLFMAVLMSFGAAFWYRTLKELVGLKDALRKRGDTPETKDDAKKDAPDAGKKKTAGG